jgi:hypothetical protein
LFVFAVVALAGGEAQADPLEIVIHDPVRNIPYNSLATFTVTLSNTTGESLLIGRPNLPAVQINRLPPFNGGGLIAFGFPPNFNNAPLPSAIAAMSSVGPSPLFTIGVTPGDTFAGVFIVYYSLPSAPGIIRSASANFSVTASQTPEPATLLLLGSGMAGLIGMAKRKRKSRGTV